MRPAASSVEQRRSQLEDEEVDDYEEEQDDNTLPQDLPFELLDETIGQGGFAFVRKGRDRNTGLVFAVKFIHKQNALESGNIGERQIMLEVSLHSHCGKHPNIIEFYATGENPIWRWIAMELAEGGDLFDKIESDVGVSPEIAHFYFTQLISGVTYIHDKGIAHRDLKPENILLDGDGNLKIADFGLATLFRHRGVYKNCRTICGSPPYVAPEVKGRNYRGDLVDIWSCGVILFVMLLGNTPWDEPSIMSWEYELYLEANGRPEQGLWSKIPPKIISLIRGMMRVEPQSRMSLNDVRLHPWFREPNRFISGTQGGDRITLATRLLEGLQIRFPGPSMPQSQPRPDDLQLPASQPEKASASTLGPRDRNIIASSQPVPPPSTFKVGYGFGGTSSLKEVRKQRLLASLLDEPSMSQFSQQPSVPISLTQAARRFQDVCPPQSLTKFYSIVPLARLVYILEESLHRAGIPIPPNVARNVDRSGIDGEAWIRIRTNDSRKCPLAGQLMLQRVCYGEEEGDEMWVVEFVKTKGDPLEWRRLFKKVAVFAKEAVYTGELDAIQEEWNSPLLANDPMDID